MASAPAASSAEPFGCLSPVVTSATHIPTSMLSSSLGACPPEYAVNGPEVPRVATGLDLPAELVGGSFA